MKKITTIIIAVLVCAAASAIPARRGFYEYTQPNGISVMLQNHGDEFFHWITNASGQIVEIDEEGYCRPVSEQVLSSRRKAGAAKRAIRNRSRINKAGEPIAVGQKHFLVILVEFDDVTFTSETANQDFHNLLNQSGYNVNGGTGSARDFYYDNSHGYFEPIFDVFGPVQLEQKVSYYGGNDSNGDDKAPEQAIVQGCTALDDQIDFSQYDNDGDGTVDLVFMYYAGKGEADGGSASTIWPHQWDLSSAGASLTLDGKRINSYACSNEIVGSGTLKGKMCGIGTACHEFGHAMGLPDFYDTDYDYYNGEAGGLYDYSTMCGGSYNNNGRTPPYFNMEERIMLGWLDSSAILDFTKSGNYTLTSVNNNVAYRTLTDQDGEYFLYECRSKEGWDSYIPEAGLIVYHVDKSSRNVTIHNGYNNISVTAESLWSNWEMYNAINENGSHPCFYVVPAGAQTNLNYSGSNWAFPGTKKVTTFTAQSWNGVESDISLSNIAYSGNVSSFYVDIPSAGLDYNVIANPGNGVYSAGSVFNLSLEESETRPVASVVWFFDDEPVNGTSVTLKRGAHVVEALITLTDGEEKTVTLELTAE